MYTELWVCDALYIWGGSCPVWRNQHISVKHKKELRADFTCCLAERRELAFATACFFSWNLIHLLAHQLAPGALFSCDRKVQTEFFEWSGACVGNLRYSQNKGLKTESVLKGKGACKDVQYLPFLAMQLDLKGHMQILLSEIVFDPNWTDFKCFLKS